MKIKCVVKVEKPEGTVTDDGSESLEVGWNRCSSSAHCSCALAVVQQQVEHKKCEQLEGSHFTFTFDYISV